MDPRQEIINVCKVLREEGLLVRTWGNVSCRIDKNTMLITPSGIKYEDLTPDKIVEVNLNDLSYKGKYKPSSEFLVHALSYKARNKCRFIAHTHQDKATIIGCLGLKEVKSMLEGENIKIHVASYGLPGSSKLAQNVYDTLKKYSNDKAIVMANHGTLCLGENAAEAVENALNLEDAAKYFLRVYCRVNDSKNYVAGYSSRRKNGEIIYSQKDVPYRVKRIHEKIYSERLDVNYIIHNKSESCVLISKRVTLLKALLDDFAQIIGARVRVPFNFHGRDGKKVYVKKNVNAVFELGEGVYALGASLDDATAAAIILNKACMAQIAATRYGSAMYLSLFDCLKMNRHYRKNYSKLANM